jgi:hypothetical protein
MSHLVVIIADGFAKRIAVSPARGAGPSAVVRTLTSSAPDGLAWSPTHPGQRRARTTRGGPLGTCGGYGVGVEAWRFGSARSSIPLPAFTAEEAEL